MNPQDDKKEKPLISEARWEEIERQVAIIKAGPKHPSDVKLEQHWDMDFEVYRMFFRFTVEELYRWMHEGEAPGEAQAFVETMTRLYQKYFGPGSAPAYEAYWTFVRPYGDGRTDLDRFLGCMCELAKKYDDQESLSFIQKEYKRMLNRPVIFY